MKKEIPIVCVFISYSWTNPEHEEWVLDLAIRLRENGVDVKLDKWDLKEGQDIYEFMEQMVNSPEVNRVLIICDKGYKGKADQRSGGVGTETQIITPEIYNDVSQEKFIPIVSETDEMNNTYIPTYIRTRKYIDMSSEDKYEQGYESLLRNLYQRPEHSKPALGIPPTWLFEDEAFHYKTSNVIKQLRDAINRNPGRIRGLSRNFIEAFCESLIQFRITEKDKDEYLDNQVFTKIEKMIVLREDYITFLELLSETFENLDPDLLMDFFEKIYAFTQPHEGLTTYYEEQFDHYRFFIQELFIYTTIILLDYSQYETLSKLLNTMYFINNRNRVEDEHRRYDAFRFYIRSIEEHRKSRLKSNRISLVADLYMQRTNEKYTKQKFVEADLLLYYISGFEEDFYRMWFPSTYIYNSDRKIRILQKLQSKSFFEKVKHIFNVTTSNELKEKIQNYKNEYSRGYSNSFETIPNIQYHIEPEKICTLG